MIGLARFLTEVSPIANENETDIQALIACNVGIILTIFVRFL